MDLGQLLQNAVEFVSGAVLLFAISAAAAAVFLSWTLDVMADKEDEPRWLAWLPICNLYLAFRLAELGLGAFMLVLCVSLGVLGAAGLLGELLGGWLLTVVAGVWAAGIWFLSFLVCVRIAQRRDVSAFFGVLAAAWPLVALLVMFPTYWPAALVPIVAWIRIAFHDGLPYHFPHPIAVPVLGVIAFAAVAPVDVITRELASITQELHGEIEAELDLGAMTAELDRMLIEQAKQGLEPPPGDPAAAQGNTNPGAPTQPPPAAAAAEPERELDASERLVTDDAACPTGTVVAGVRPPGGNEVWCEKNGVRHGPYVAWYDTGQVKTRGVFDEGLEAYQWLGFWENGNKKVEARFRNGMQHGRMTQYDDTGIETSESEWRNGEPYIP